MTQEETIVRMQIEFHLFKYDDRKFFDKATIVEKCRCLEKAYTVKIPYKFMVMCLSMYDTLLDSENFALDFMKCMFYNNLFKPDDEELVVRQIMMLSMPNHLFSTDGRVVWARWESYNALGDDYKSAYFNLVDKINNDFVFDRLH